MKKDPRPEITLRYAFTFRGTTFGFAHLKLGPNVSPVTVIVEQCPCGNKDCVGWNAAQVDTTAALALMGAGIDALLADQKTAENQTKPGAN